MGKGQPIQPGEMFGRLKAIRVVEQGTGRGKKWLCICQCPNYGAVEAFASTLRSGNTRSCGCLKKDKPRELAIFYSAFGQEMTISELAEAAKKFHSDPPKSAAIYGRIKKGWSVEDAVKTPKQKPTNKGKKYKKREGSISQLVDLSAQYHTKPLTRKCIAKRLEAGWSVEDAVKTPRWQQKRFTDYRNLQ